MILVDKKITIAELIPMSEKMSERMVKAVVDVERGIMAVDAPMHVDLEAFMLDDHESKQKNLWGINIYPTHPKEARIVFDSMINLRPVDGNRSRSVDDPKLREVIKKIVNKLVVE